MAISQLLIESEYKADKVTLDDDVLELLSNPVKWLNDNGITNPRWEYADEINALQTFNFDSLFTRYQTQDRDNFKDENGIPLKNHIPGHALRMANYSYEIAKTANLHPVDVLLTTYGALFHDVGKSHDSKKKFFNTAPMNAEEWEEMNQHVEVSYKELIDAGCTRVAHIVRNHRKMSSDVNIPPCVHKCTDIVKLTDTIDTISSRVYGADRNYTTGEFSTKKQVMNDIKSKKSELSQEYTTLLLKLLEDEETLSYKTFESLSIQERGFIGNQTIRLFLEYVLRTKDLLKKYRIDTSNPGLDTKIIDAFHNINAYEKPFSEDSNVDALMNQVSAVVSVYESKVYEVYGSDENIPHSGTLTRLDRGELKSELKGIRDKFPRRKGAYDELVHYFINNLDFMEPRIYGNPKQ